MVCICCGKSYCHKKSPCARDLRIEVSWCGVTGVSSRINPLVNGLCGNRLGEGDSGNGVFERITAGACSTFVQVMLGTGYVLNQKYGGLSCCRRTSLRGAAIEGGTLIVNVSRYTAIRWDFSFSSLDAAVTLVKRYTFEDLSYAGSCSNAILGEWNSCKNTEPVLRLLMQTWTQETSAPQTKPRAGTRQ